jgi:hypothetical protein
MQNSGGAASLGSGDTETFMFGYKIITWVILIKKL